MKVLTWLLLSVGLGFWARGESTDPYTTLGLAAPATATEINQAFSKSISELMDALMSGDATAIDRSQKLAKARLQLLSAQDCAATLVPELPSAPAPAVPHRDNDVAVNYLNSVYPDIFPPGYRIFDPPEIDKAVVRLADQPRIAMDSLTLTEGELRARFPDDPTISSLTAYQKAIAAPLGQYLRRNSLQNPRQLQTFEEEIAKSLKFAGRNELAATRWLRALHDLTLPPGPALLAVVPLLEDYRAKVTRMAEGVLLAGAVHFGLPLSFEEPLIKSKNPYALTILANSRKSYSEAGTEKILKRLRTLQEADVFRSVVYLLLQRPELKDQVLEIVKARWSDAKETWPIRLFASETLIDHDILTSDAEYFLLRSIPFAQSEELYHLSNWCYSSDRCPPAVKAVIQNSRYANLY